ncbi:MAG: HU family DNA-binding protein [Rhodobacterales bacterium]
MPVVSAPEMKKRDLLEKVVKRSGIKKKDAKPVVEAMLAVMGEALVEGRELNLPPFGKLKTNRIKDTGNARILNCKLRQGGGNGTASKEALAETDD